MTWIVALETSTDRCSVSIHKGAEVKGERFLDERGAHSRVLPSLIAAVLREAGIELSDVSAIALSEGPGSYTGLRIGASTAKGLSFALDAKMIGISTLKVLEYQARIHYPGLPVVSMLDARRMEVYREIYDASGEVLAPAAPEILDVSSFSDLLKDSEVCLVGNCNEKVRSLIQSPRAIFLDAYPDSKGVGVLAWEKFQQGQFENIAYFTPNYLKEFRVLKSRKNPFL